MHNPSQQILPLTEMAYSDGWCRKTHQHRQDICRLQNIASVPGRSTKVNRV